MSNPANQKIFLITGSSKGIGRFIAEYYAKLDYFVIGCSRSKSDFNHPNYLHFEIDISNESDVMGMFREIKTRYKRIDVLINNAAINPAIISAAILPSVTIENVFKTNVFATMVFCREAVKLMLRNKSGRIINFGSMATRHEVPGEALYTATKSAIIGYTRVLAKEVARSNITVNILAPSAIKTALSAKINQEALQEVLSRNAIHEYGNFEDVSNAVDFLIKDESHSITGQIIYLGGA
ncbi:MAG: SDR family oxidoreductase [Bacteroidota bacterium]